MMEGGVDPTNNYIEKKCVFFKRMCTYIVPEPGIPIVCIVVTINWKKKMKKKTMKLNEESERNALYAGLNQHK